MCERIISKQCSLQRYHESNTERVRSMPIVVVVAFSHRTHSLFNTTVTSTHVRFAPREIVCISPDYLVLLKKAGRSNFIRQTCISFKNNLFRFISVHLTRSLFKQKYNSKMSNILRNIVKSSVLKSLSAPIQNSMGIRTAGVRSLWHMSKPSITTNEHRCTGGCPCGISKRFASNGMHFFSILWSNNRQSGPKDNGQRDRVT